MNCHSFLWRNFEFEYPLVLTESALKTIVNHSSRFNKFMLTAGSLYNLQTSCIDNIFQSGFCRSNNLYWISLVGAPISSLKFVEFAPNLEIVDLTKCSHLIDEEYLNLQYCHKLDYLYVSFTNITPKTISLITKGKGMTVIDACGIEFDIVECKSLISQVQDYLLHLSISLKQGIKETQFVLEIEDFFIDISIHLYRK